MTSVDKARRSAAAAKARPQPARASKASAKERPRRAKEPVPAPAGKPSSDSAKAKAQRPPKAAASPSPPAVAKPAAKTSAPSPAKKTPASAAKRAEKGHASAAKRAERGHAGAAAGAEKSQAGAAPSDAEGSERTSQATVSSGPSGRASERSESPPDRLPATQPTEKPRRGLGALGKRAFSAPAPVLPLLTAPRAPSRQPAPVPLPAGDLPAVAAGALPRDAIEFLRSELHALLALAEEPPLQP